MICSLLKVTKRRDFADLGIHSLKGSLNTSL